MNATSFGSGQHPVFSSSILQGLHLLEADAGTGKTWTLTGLVVRAIVERNLGIESILAVTFTKAAVAELKSRTRSRLLEMAAALSAAEMAPPAAHAARASVTNPDPFIAGYLEQITAGKLQDSEGELINAELALRRIRLALAKSDELAAFTLHGFCQRLLSSQPLLTRTPPELEPVADASAAITLAVRDWWRAQVLSLSLADASLLLALGLRLKTLVDGVKQCLNDPLALLIGVRPDWRDALRTAIVARIGLAGAVQADRERIVEWFGAGKSGKAKIDGRFSPRRSTLKHLQSLLEFSQADRVADWPQEALVYFSTARFERLGANVEMLGKLSLVRVCDDFLQRFERQLNPILGGMIVECLQQVRARLAQNRFAGGEISYDDLVRLTYEALLDERNGQRLAAGVRQRYPFALVDECQDTDPMQWSILRSVWPMNSAHRHTDTEGLILVGDPKQSIYRFRGADIYAYLEARSHWSTAHADANHAHSSVIRPKLARLDENQRSDPAVLRGINCVFSVARSFVIPQIQYLDSKPGNRERAEFETVAGSIGGSERGAFCWVQWSLPEKPDVQSIALACASEINSLLAGGGCTLNGAPLSPKDIAVLVGRHDEGRAVKAALKALGLGAVEITREQVTTSDEAYELLRIVAAVASPGETNLLRGALATRALGVPFSDLDKGLIEHAVLFEEARLLWPIHGPLAALNNLFRHFDTPAHLASVEQAERTLTNHTHMLELLAGATQAQAGAAQGLRWLQRVIDQEERPEVESEELELRLESDSNLIRILTLHKSKGLEFPVVFVPFAWHARRRNNTSAGLRFHRPARPESSGSEGNEALDSVPAWEAVIDLNFAHLPDSVQLQQVEELAERLRLLYVALTRARHRCYLFGPPLAVSQSAAKPDKGAGNNQSAIDYLLGLYTTEYIEHGMDSISRLDIVELLNLEARPMPALAEGASKLQLAKLQRRLFRGWSSSSYSGILASAQHSAEVLADSPRDRDQWVEGAGSPESGISIRYDFPAGANAGACLHRILEETDFAKGVDSARAARTVASYGLQAQPAADLARWLNEVLDTELGVPGLRLRDIALEDRLVEFEFNLRVAGLSNADLIQVIRASEPIELELPARQWQGFLKGFIDLVFRFDGRYYLLDWKSNWLGNTPAAYGSESMNEAIREHSYSLQYSIYQLALHRHLKLRMTDYDPARHLGGVFYLFIRGVGAAKDTTAGSAPGIYFRPAQAGFLQALDHVFAGAADQRQLAGGNS